MKAAGLFTTILAALALSGCAERESPQPAPAASPAPARPVEKPSFVNKVWAVRESQQVEPGSLRVFLSDGTLVMASPNAAPAFGSWTYQGDRLTITEEGLAYETDIVELTERGFRIRIHSPGEPVEILFAPAESIPPASVAGAPRAVAASAPEPVPLWGTAWRLENLAGTGVLDRVQATLEFPSEGRASGSASCNRFNGVVTVEGRTITFGGMAATRKACAQAVMRQEDAYLAGLRDAERFEIEGETLRIYTANGAEPLHFVAWQPPAIQPAKPAGSSSPTPSSTQTLAGIWTVVAHHTPGVSAISDAEAAARHGETLRLTASSAISRGVQCREPTYASSRVPAAPYLATEFKLAPGSVKPLAARDQIHRMEVTCGGTRWAALGGVLLEIDEDRALAPWDGVFFELARDHDFRALGQEPGWQLEIRKGSEIRFIYDYGRRSVVTPAAKAQVASNTGTTTYHAVTGSNDLRIEIVPVRCADTMSGRPFRATVTVTLNGESFRGCGEELATPYQG